MPSDWTKGIIIKLPKKGALNDCNNWRGITFISVPSKILAKITIQRISDSADEKLRKEQAGFRKKQGIHRPDRCTQKYHRAVNRVAKTTRLVVCTGLAFGRFSGTMETPRNLSRW